MKIKKHYFQMTSTLYRFLKRFTKHLINIKDFGGNSVSRMIWIRGRKRRGKVTLVRLDDDWRWECLQHQWRFIYRQWVVSSKEHLGFYSKNWFEHLPPIIAIFQNCPPHCDNLIIIIITIHEAVHWSVCGCALNGPFDNGPGGGGSPKSWRAPKLHYNTIQSTWQSYNIHAYCILNYQHHP